MNDFESVKNAVNLLEVITQETGLKMKGKHLEECPFCGGHGCFSLQEKYFTCFQCSEKGDVFAFVEKYLAIDDKREQLEKAAKYVGIEIKDAKKRKKLSARNLDEKEKIFIEAAEYYHGHFLENGGQDYFVKTRKHSEDALKSMRVGWADGGLVDHLRGKGFADKDIKASNLGKDWEDKKNERTVLVDFFRKGLAIFPHVNGERVDHFTMKDPEGKLLYQLPAGVRAKQWRFYNQAVFDRYSEIIVVEGENDLLGVMTAGVDHVVGIIGGPADYQIKWLRSHAAHKHIYLWLDNDADEKKIWAKGKGYIRKICTELAEVSNIRIITYGKDGDDPDSYLKAFDGDRKKEVKRLQLEAVDYLTWELAEIAKLNGLDNRLNALKERGVFAALAELVEAEKLVFVENIVQFGLTPSAIEEQIELNQTLKMDLEDYFTDLKNIKDADPHEMVSRIYKYFSRNGRFFYDRMDVVYLLYQHKTFIISNNQPFRALMKKMTRLQITKEPGRSVWDSLQCEAYICGKQIDIASWILTDRNTDTFYANLNLPGNNILRVSAESISEIPNGMNDEGVFLKSSHKLLPMNYLPDCNISEGMQVLNELVLENLTCDKEQKYLVLCWFMSAFLIDFSPYMSLMKFSGATASGKTTAARLLSILIYGDAHLGKISTAAKYSVASQEPLLILDNLESCNMTKSDEEFLLLAPVKTGKEKRTSGTESGTTEEKPRSLVLITAIEPFEKAETINRTYDIEFSIKNRSDDFIEDETTGDLVKKRNLILSSIFKFIHKDVLPNLDKRRDYITILKKEYKNHSKSRTDEYLALLMLMLDKILHYIPLRGPDDLELGIDDKASDIWKEWIEVQDARAKDSETGSNSIVKQLDGIVRECLAKMKDDPKEMQDHEDYPEGVFKYRHEDYLLEILKTKGVRGIDENEEPYTRTTVEFVASAGDIVYAFDKLSRNMGTKNPYSSGSVFASRLRNDIGVLKKANWDVVSRKGFEPYWTRKHGTRYWKLRKTIIR